MTVAQICKTFTSDNVFSLNSKQNLNILHIFSDAHMLTGHGHSDCINAVLAR